MACRHLVASVSAGSRFGLVVDAHPIKIQSETMTLSTRYLAHSAIKQHHESVVKGSLRIPVIVNAHSGQS